MPDDPTCHKCTEPRADADVHKCPVCFRHFCDEHAHEMSGRRFCSVACAQYFFFGDPED